MVQAQQPGKLTRWAWATLTLALGGALLTFVALWLMQALATMSGGARLSQLGQWAILGATLVSWVLVGLAGFWLLRRLGWERWPAIQALMGWLLGYIILWWLSNALSSLSLPLYLGFWLIFGALGGWLVARADPQRAASGGRRDREVVRSAQFGRVPAATVVLLTQHVRHATGPILAGLPSMAPQLVREFTVRAVLERTIRDWWANGNADGLAAQDVADLRSFVSMAAVLSDSARDPAGQAIYRATLTALLDDWLANWNADGVDGPPLRR